jgi:hypothetical protein
MRVSATLALVVLTTHGFAGASRQPTQAARINRLRSSVTRLFAKPRSLKAEAARQSVMRVIIPAVDAGILRNVSGEQRWVDDAMFHGFAGIAAHVYFQPADSAEVYRLRVWADRHTDIDKIR